MKANPLSVEAIESILKLKSSNTVKINSRESSRLEFKESYNHSGMAAYFKTMASFANNDGGYIIFGIKDAPRVLIGLKDKSFDQFENIKVEVITKYLLDYFSPEIKWEHCTFDIREYKLGVIYTYPLEEKPCICKKNLEDKNPKYSLKEGDIYYRDGGRSEKIKFTELKAIIDRNRADEEKRWIKFAQKAAKIGVQNACLLDLKNGNIDGKTHNIIIDEKLLSQIKFVHEGHFVDNGGSPTLNLIGNIQNVESGKVVITNSPKITNVKYIETDDIIEHFLDDQVEDQKEAEAAVKAICSSQSCYYPIYFFIYKSKISIETAKAQVQNLRSSHQSIKTKLMERLCGNRISQTSISKTNSAASKQKEKFFNFWKDSRENLKERVEYPKYAFEAILALSDEAIVENEKHIRRVLKSIWKNEKEKIQETTGTSFRKALCRIDEALYIDKI